MFDEVAAPVAQRHRVVMAEVLLVQHFQADLLDLGGNTSRARQLPVGENVTVGEPAGKGRRPVVVAGDAVIEQQAAGAQLRLEKPEVERVILDADVLG